MTILVTGGAGFIGSNFVNDWLAQCDEPVVNLDALTYAGNLDTLSPLDGDGRHLFVQGDIGEPIAEDDVMKRAGFGTVRRAQRSAGRRPAGSGGRSCGA